MNLYECETLTIGKLSGHNSSELVVKMNEINEVEQLVGSARCGIRENFVNVCVCITNIGFKFNLWDFANNYL